jgi:hypothetical protein
MEWQRIGRNVLRYVLVGAVVSVPALYYGLLGFGLILGSMLPAMVASALLVEFIPSAWSKSIARVSAAVASTFVGYLGIALLQTAAGLSDIPPEISPWSPTYLPTFLGLVAGFAFGLAATLRPRSAIVRR